MQEKLAITVLVITLALFALVMVLYDLSKEKKADYNKIVLSQQEYDSRVIPYQRGDIVDRNGTYLATNDEVYNLILDPSQILSSDERHLEATVKALVDIFGYNREELISLVREKHDKAYVRYDRQLTLEQKEAFEALKEKTNLSNAEADNKSRIRGVWFESEYKRVYPYGSLACNVLGFSGGDGSDGTGGIEQYYNSTLIGVNGREYGYLNDDFNLERVIKPAKNGNTIVTTIDANIQKIVEKHIDEWQAEMGGKRTAVIVMDPNNGEILAMASDGRFDLNNPRQLGPEYTDAVLVPLGEKEAVADYRRKHKGEASITIDQVYEHYNKDEIRSFGEQVAWNQIWRNFCVSDTFEPGSPSKIFTISGGLEEGILKGNESFFCDGFQQVTDRRIRCVKRTGHGMLTLEESLMQSCNDAMMQIAAMEGKNIFYKYQKLFGFGGKTGIDLPGEADTSTLVHDAEKAVPAELATDSFGQGYNCTMIQMAAAYCSVINGGSYYQPHVMKQVLNEQGSIVKKNTPLLVNETVSENTSNFINQALFRTVADGTGSAAAVPGYEIGGKTGTAEKIPRRQGNYLVSFVGFAPIDNPQVLVYVIIDEPNTDDQAHSSFASKVFQKIMAEILPYRNIFPVSELEDEMEENPAQMPAEEGITENKNGEGEKTQPEETAAPETKVYETDEFVETGGEENGTDSGSGLPDDIPGGSEEPLPDNSGQETAETAQNSAIPST